MEIIHSLKNKSSGPSSMPLKMLSIIPDLIILPLAHIINMSLPVSIQVSQQKTGHLNLKKQEKQGKYWYRKQEYRVVFST